MLESFKEIVFILISMYDFYDHPPNTKQELREWLTSWLEKPSSISPLLEINGEQFIQELGFRRAFYSHSVFRSLLTNEYIWWVSEEFDINTFPSQRFTRYEELLEYVINDYYKRWNLAG